ncbi:MAG: copper chaperone PCu(A)C [Nocardioidaceae bacterium]
MTYNHAPTGATRWTRRRSLRMAVATAAAVVLGLASAACGSADAESSDTAGRASIEVKDGWVRATTGTEDTSMTAAFMQIDNNGASDIRLVSVQASVAGMTQLHEMTMVDGAMAMQEVADGIAIASGRGTLLEPGGRHVMLMDVKHELAPGDEVQLTLTFSDGSTKALTLPVKEFTEEEGHYHSPGAEEHTHGADDHTDDETEMEPTPS